MDGIQFDRLVRFVGQRIPRRGFTALAIPGLITLSVLGNETRDTLGKKKKKKVVICLDGQTIKISKKAKKKYLRQGATQGACGGPIDPGPSTEIYDACVETVATSLTTEFYEKCLDDCQTNAGANACISCGQPLIDAALKQSYLCLDYYPSTAARSRHSRAKAASVSLKQAATCDQAKLEQANSRTEERSELDWWDTLIGCIEGPTGLAACIPRMVVQSKRTNDEMRYNREDFGCPRCGTCVGTTCEECKDGKTCPIGYGPCFCDPTTSRLCPDGSCVSMLECCAGETTCGLEGCCTSTHPLCCQLEGVCCLPGYTVCCEESEGGGCCTPAYPVCCSDYCCRSSHPICFGAGLCARDAGRQSRNQDWQPQPEDLEEGLPNGSAPVL